MVSFTDFDLLDYSTREYTTADYPEVISIWEATSLGGAERGDNYKTIDQSIALGGKLLLLYHRESEKVVGTSWMTFDGRRIHLHHFGISPAFQGQGLSKILLRESLKHVKSSGYQVKIEVHKDNIKAIKLYQSMGFDYLGDYVVYIIRDVDGI
jgi:ribosomal protein S18 acetylase RimI-like enzyme